MNIILMTILFLILAMEVQSCHPSGKIKGVKPPPDRCHENDLMSCCTPGKLYTTYNCSAPVSGHTKATLTLNTFEHSGGAAPCECDNKFHSDDEPVVALSSGWFNRESRCLKFIKIFWNGRSTEAKVVDECDSTAGCDAGHDYAPPCPNNIVDASMAVWRALGVPEREWGELNVYWTDA